MGYVFSAQTSSFFKAKTKAMFIVDNIHELLLSQNLITTNSLINGDYVSTSITRRNRNLQITTLSEGNYLIKQVYDKNSGNAKTVTNEISFYNYLENFCPDLKPLCPEVKYVDKDSIVLILNFYTNAIPLWKYYKTRTIDKFPLETSAVIGLFLSKIHAVFSNQNVFNDPELSFLTRDLPFAFTMYKPVPKLLSFIKPGGLKLIQQIQSRGDIMDILQSTEQMWEVNSIIHGDIKLDNFLVIDDPEMDEGGSTNIKIIDWEMAQYGDFAWDIAGVFQDFIFWWAISMPNEKTAKEMVQKASFPIDKLKPGVSTFWDSYCRNSGLSEQSQTVLLNKVVLFSGLRVLQTAYEISSKLEDIPAIAEVLLGIGKSILRKPKEAAVSLYGIQN